MAIVTALEVQKAKPGRVNVYLDGEFAFGAADEVVVRYGLRHGLDLAPDQISQIKCEDAVATAYAQALNLLSFRPRSHREFSDYFRRKRIEPEVSNAALERLSEARLIDDREFARYWVENRRAFRPRSALALKAELRQKGVDQTVIDEVLEGSTDEESAAYAAGRRKASSFEELGEDEFSRRMIGFLRRRGFAYDVARASSRRLYEELHPDAG